MLEHEIYARSDVARDILQNADYFTSAGKAVNEYVWNSIDYRKPGSRVEVLVRKTRGKISVRKRRVVKFNGIIIEETKNGGGMSRGDLRRFFTMHGETLARKEGRTVRGRFGTGKSAAFGIGRTLIVDAIKGGKRNVLRMDLEDLKPGLEKVPVQDLLTDQDTDRPSGTTIIIDRLKLRKVKVESLKKFLRRSLGLHLRNHDIFVDGEKLGYSEPESEKEWSFACPEDLQPILGSCLLMIKLAKGELEDEERGVAILSNSYPMEFYSLDRAGPWASRLFGMVDVPLLDSPDEIATFDNTRSRLNRDNARVARLIDWVDSDVATVVTELDDQARLAMSQKELERLKETAKEIEELLNEDFSDVLDEIESRPPVGGKGSLVASPQERKAGVQVLVKDESGDVKATEDPEGDAIILTPVASGEDASGSRPNDPTLGRLSDDGETVRESSAGGVGKKPRGGFRITYVKEGPDAPRAAFAKEKMEIRINLDHPELAIFKSTEDPRFKALSGEIALSEYAIATVNYKVEYGHVDVSNTAYDALIEFRRTINRLGRRFAPLLTRWLELT